MASSLAQNATPATINQLLVKITDVDPDLRYMSLNDLLTVLENCKPDMLLHDYNTAARTVDNLIKALDDQNGEVQNLAIKCLGPLVVKVPMQIIAPMLEKLATLKLQNSPDNSVPALALKAVIEALPRPVPGLLPSKDVTDAYAAISRVLIPRLLGRPVQTVKHNVRLPAMNEGMLDAGFQMVTESVDVLIEVVRCYGSMLQSYEVEALQDAVVGLLAKDGGPSSVKKRAVVAISILAVYTTDDLLNGFVTRMLDNLKQPSTSPGDQRLYITIMGSMARSIPGRFGQHLSVVMPVILTALGEEELEKGLEAVEEGNDSTAFNDVREAALATLEALLASCPDQMRSYTDDIIAACLRYLKYDPNYAVDDDEDDEMEDADEDEDDFDEDDEFGDTADFEDDDDSSWKVRKCAARALYTLISTRSSGDLLDNGELYSKAAPALIKRFTEREESVRLEAISAMALLVRRTGEGVGFGFSADESHNEYMDQQPHSRKRRRQSSGGGASALSFTRMSSDLAGLASPTSEAPPTTGPRADLAAKTPAIVKAANKLLKGKFVPTKHAVVALLHDIVAVQHGGLSDYFQDVVPSVTDAVKATSGSSSHAAGTGNAASITTLRVAALRLIGQIARFHSSKLLQQYIPNLITGVIAATGDKYYKIAGEAIQTLEEMAKAITPPRSRLTTTKYKPEVQKLYDVLQASTSATDSDADVRQKAIGALGTLLARTGTEDGATMLSSDKRQAALNQLLDRMRNETTRLAAVRAVDNVASSTSAGLQFDSQWVKQAAVELAAQSRKANRTLSGSSIQALRHLCQSPAAQGSFDQATIQVIVSALQPAIMDSDVLLLNPALRILTALMLVNPGAVLTQDIIKALCTLLQTNAAATVQDPLTHLAESAGKAGVGQALMKALLQDVGMQGDSIVVGKVIGALLVSSGDSSGGLSVDSFVTELKKAEKEGDPNSASLSLAILGEVAYRQGASSPLKPDLFLARMTKDFNKTSSAAAVALGRAGAGNPSGFLPVILSTMTAQPGLQFALLQSVREILQLSVAQTSDIKPYTATIWDQLLKASEVEDNKPIAAECLGRLAMIDPAAFVPQLQALLGDSNPAFRAITAQAIRYTLPDSGENLEEILKANDCLVRMLQTMLADKDLGIRRLGLTALNSAAHNKPEMILPHLKELVAFVLNESKVKPELIREVQMGPFKHKVDDGLDLRKGAYETLYALMETSLTRINVIELYDRVVAGLGDDHDIRALCNLMVSKLLQIAPEESLRRLDSIAEEYRATLSTKLKENAVKQEVEKQDEANKSVLRMTLQLGDKLKSAAGVGSITDVAAHPIWTQYWDWVNVDFRTQLKDLRDQSKDRAAA